MRNLSRTVVNSMIYFTVVLTGPMIMILFTNIYYISGPGVRVLDEFFHLILPAIPSALPIYREHYGSEVTKLVRGRSTTRIWLCLMPKTLLLANAA